MAKQTITIGRGSKNTIQLKEANVSTNHARIILAADELILEDLGSTNGTAVGNEENKIQRTRIQIEDTVYFGSTAYRVADLLALANNTIPTINPTTVSAQPTKQSSTTRVPLLPVVVCVAVVLVLGLGGILYAVFFNQTNNDSQTAEANQETRGQPTQSSDNKNSLANSDRQQVDTADDGDNATGEVTNRSVGEVLERSLFVIVCSDENRNTPFRVGTGFAIGENEIATSGAVIEAIESLGENGYPVCFVYCPATDKEWAIERYRKHPDYVHSTKQARQAQDQYDALFDQLEENPPDPDSFEQVKDQLLAARNQAMSAIEQKTTFDMGVLNIEGPLDDWLQSATNTSSVRPNMKLIIEGFPFDVEDPFFDPQAGIAQTSASTRLRQLLKHPDAGVQRLLATAPAQQMELAFVGCPIMNSQGQVLAIYSRPTPVDPHSPSEGDSTLDAVYYPDIHQGVAKHD